MFSSSSMIADSCRRLEKSYELLRASARLLSDISDLVYQPGYPRSARQIVRPADAVSGEDQASSQTATLPERQSQ